MERRCLALVHVACEDLGVVEAVLRRRGFTVRYVEPGLGGLEGLDPAADDLVVVLGGPIGVYESDLYPWITQEIAFVKARIDSGRPTLGICLGAQMIAAALGAGVHAGTEKEIGWAPVTLTPDGHASPLAPLDGVEVLHWHGDTFDLPAGAARLASTGITLNQAFAQGPGVLALQFHVEGVGATLERWLITHRAELGATPGLSIPALRAATQRAAPAAEAAGVAVIGAFLDENGL